MRGSLLYVNLAHFLDHYFLLIFPTAVLAIAPTWGMTYGEALALATPSFVAFALATPLAGWMGDRYGEVPMMVAFFIGIGLAAVATGLAVGPVSLAIGLAAIGLFASIYHPVGTAYLVRLAAKTGAALGVNGVFGNMGVAAAAGLTGVITATFGWRAAFILPGAFTLALGVLFALHAKRVPALAQAQGPKAAIDAPRSDQVRVLAVVVVASLFGGLAFHGVTIALPKLFEERLGDAVTITEIGFYAALVFALAAFTQIPAGLAIDRIGAKPVMVVMTFMQAVLFLVISQIDGMLAVLIAVPLMLAVFGEVPVNAWLISRYVAPEWRGRAYSMQFLLALGVTAFIVPLIVLLHEQTGSQAALFIVLSGAMSLVFVAAWLLPGWRRAMPRPQPAPAE
jgi:MFS family permease